MVTAIDCNTELNVTAANRERLEVLIAAARLADGGEGGYGEWAYRTWAEHNDRYFDGRLLVGGIGWGLTKYGDTLGHYEPWRNFIMLHTSLVEPRSNPWGKGMLMGKRYASDVLLHEMVHQANKQQYGWMSTPPGGIHNRGCWVDEINRVSLLLGLPARAAVVKQRRVNKRVCWEPKDGYMSITEMGQWPHGLREPGYFNEVAE